jgi:hypothetical protein
MLPALDVDVTHKNKLLNTHAQSSVVGCWFMTFDSYSLQL